jgi:hypothetical protein
MFKATSITGTINANTLGIAAEIATPECVVAVVVSGTEDEVICVVPEVIVAVED